MKKKPLLLVILLFNQCNAHVYYAEYWQYLEGEKEVQMPFKLYTFHDRHVGHEEAHPQQKKDILHFVRATNSSFISETKESQSTTPTIYDVYKRVRYVEHPLRDLSLLTAYSGIVTSNIDFRLHGKTLKDRKKETDEQITITRTYNDPRVLTEYYHRCIKRHETLVAPACRFLCNNLDRVKDPEVKKIAKSVTDWYNPMLNIETLEKHVWKAELFSYYNTEFVDLKILHALSEHGKQGITSTVVYAGGAHGEGIRSALIQLGYRLKKFVRLSENSENNDLHKLRQALHKLEPEYNPDAPLPKTMADLLLDYAEFEHEHPHLIIAIPAGILATLAGAIAYLIATIISSSNGVQQ